MTLTALRESPENKISVRQMSRRGDRPVAPTYGGRLFVWNYLTVFSFGQGVKPGLELE
ncbi:Uncharacterized protein dnl_14400 [Desulfonema limicola]|uniref:Uncharacterized protein n=1 Tax=Desulfonema limicola TaxID=45656 RepID=A0A975B5I1_9BACT|nr:Uncharacterized protein dnl_14400 [Desulfonema limicola]